MCSLEALEGLPDAQLVGWPAEEQEISFYFLGPALALMLLLFYFRNCVLKMSMLRLQRAISHQVRHCLAI